MKNEPITLTNVEIQKILPHRYPFLLIDKIVDFEEEIVSSTGELITQLKDVNVFKKFHIDRTFGTVEWENGFDYDPDILYEIGINLWKT